MRVLVVGGGSIGKRHAKNLKELGVEHVAVVDPRADRRQEIKERLDITSLYTDVKTALREGYDAVVVGVPTAYHAEVAARSIEAGAHVLMEKPISNRCDGLPEILAEARQRKLVFLVGYTYRFWPPLLKVKELLQAGVVGRVIFADIVFSEYLPDWHPWEDYRSWFMAKKELGGGALLDESHAVDMARWLFGEVEEVFCRTGNLSSLEMSADDYAQFVMTFASGAMGTIHMDLFGRKPRRLLHVYGERGSITWDFFANRVDVDQVEARLMQTFTFACERNDMFLSEMRHFLQCISGQAQPCVTGEDAMETLEVLLAGIESSDMRRVVNLR